MARVIFSIARNTFRECLREPIFVILQLTSLTIIGTYPVFALFVFREQEKLVIDGSLATTLLFGWISAVLCASHAVAREMDTGTASLILAKPVNRGSFMLAKILGILAVLSIGVWCNAIATLLALRVAKDQFQLDYYIFTAFFLALLFACVYGAFRNYTRGLSFSACTTSALTVLVTLVGLVVWKLPERTYSGYDWSKPVGYPPNLIKAAVLILFAVWALGTLAVALSTHFNLVSNLTVCFVIFVVGLLSDYVFAKVSQLTYPDVVRLAHYWPYTLPPFTLFFWFLAYKHYHQRRRSDTRLLAINVAFALPFLVLVARVIADSLSQRHLDQPSALVRGMAQVIYPAKDVLAGLFHAAIPNWQLFWLADALAAEKDIPLEYLGFGAAYILLFIVLFALLGFVLFASREVGRQMPR